MEGTEDVSRLFAPVVSKEEWNQIPGELAKKIQRVFVDKIEEFLTSKAVLETNRRNAEKGYGELEDRLKASDAERKELAAKVQAATLTIEDLEKEISRTTSDIAKLQASCNRLEEEAADFRHQRNMAIR